MPTYRLQIIDKENTNKRNLSIHVVRCKLAMEIFYTKTKNKLK